MSEKTDRFSDDTGLQFLGDVKLVTEDVTPPDRKEQNRKREEATKK